MSAFFVKRYNMENSETTKEERERQIEFIDNYLHESRLIVSAGGIVTLLPAGFRRIDDLQKNQSHSKNAFIAMSFSEDMNEVREAVRRAIEATGYIPRIMDEIEHNKQIVPEMLFEIRQSRFLVAELTGHNNGAYYEAGYAAGLGKEVIHICKKDAFGADGHFDVKQKATILWETAEDLTEALRKRIEATVT